MFRRKSHASHTEVADQHSHPSIEVVDDDNFEELSAGRPTIIDFWAPWCGPCRSFRPMFESAAAHWEDSVRFGSCNVDDNVKTAALLNVISIPTVIAFGPDGSEVGRLIGVPSRQRFEALITALAEKADQSAS